jgi:glucosamine--fructose-6-phosphate aminotransferase (isomerizing)
VVEGLKKLEYRGYDSWGFCAKDSRGKIHLYKEVGKISDTKGIKCDYKTGFAMAHTRWATHGGVTYENCHPHTSENQDIIVVQNGIVENFQELRSELRAKGHVFSSETDTEVLPHLIQEYIEFGFEKACKKALARLEGAFAFVIMSAQEDLMFIARRDSPLIVGKGKDEFFVASDITPFAEYTRDVMYLDDDECAVISTTGIQFYSLVNNSELKKRVVTINWDTEGADKGDFDHFMLKEIMEQKETIIKAINQSEEDILIVTDKIKKAYGTFFIGCGTANKVCMVGEYFFSKIAHKHINAIVASEFVSYKHFLKDRSLIIAISQSGETIDIIEPIKEAKKKGAQIISLVNVEGSSVYRLSDYAFLIHAGPEQAVASTKAATSQLALLLLMAYATANKLHEGKQLLIETASKINDMLNPRYLEHIKKLAKQIYKQENAYIIGRNSNYPMALESAIKIQEVSYIHAEGFAGGELKHGPIALIQKGVPCIALMGNDEFKEAIISNCMEIKARGGMIIGVSPKHNPVFDFWIKVPDCGNAQPIVNIIPIQILAYYLAVLRGKDPDKPRNLAKSVTVK